MIGNEIKGRAELAKAWRKEMSEHKRLSEKNIYIRIHENDYLPISVHQENACGALKHKETDTEIESAPTIAEAILRADIANRADKKEPNSHKGEHRVQASLIQHALCNDLKCHDRFIGFDDIFEELLFVTDELVGAIEKPDKETNERKTVGIRADVVALGRKKQRYFPVLIELKDVRDPKRLTEQLTDALEYAKYYSHDFLCLISNITGVAIDQILLDNAKLMVIWHGTKTGQERSPVGVMREAGILIAEYPYDGFVPGPEAAPFKRSLGKKNKG